MWRPMLTRGGFSEKKACLCVCVCVKESERASCLWGPAKFFFWGGVRGGVERAKRAKKNKNAIVFQKVRARSSPCACPRQKKRLTSRRLLAGENRAGKARIVVLGRVA